MESEKNLTRICPSFVGANIPLSIFENVRIDPNRRLRPVPMNDELRVQSTLQNYINEPHLYMRYVESVGQSQRDVSKW